MEMGREARDSVVCVYGEGKEGIEQGSMGEEGREGKRKWERIV